MKNKQNIISIIIVIILFVTGIIVNSIDQQRKGSKILKLYLLMHNYYYDSTNDIYKRNNIPLYIFNPKDNTYELDAYAKGLNIYVKYDYKTKISNIEYTNNNHKKIAYYNHKKNVFDCDDSDDVCETIKYFPENAYSEFNNILKIANLKYYHINSIFL